MKYCKFAALLAAISLLTACNYQKPVEVYHDPNAIITEEVTDDRPGVIIEEEAPSGTTIETPILPLN